MYGLNGDHRECMASGYMYEEALNFYTKYFALFPSTLVAKFVMGKKNKQMQGNYCKVGFRV
jgi:hypothetical protein